MGKTDNIKRAKRLKEAKRKREQDALIAAGLGPAGIELRKKKHHDGTEFRHNEGKVKYSELLSEFVAPIIENIDDEKILKTKYLFGSFVWNAAILKEINESKYFKIKDEVCSLGIDIHDIQDIENLFEEMAVRKQREFSEYTNLIMDVEVKKIRGNDYDLTVATSPINRK